MATLVAVIIVLPSAAAGQPSAAAGDPGGVTLTGLGTATIDGVVSPGEWNGAGVLSFAANLPGGLTVPATLQVMNDTKNLYLAVTVDSPVPQSMVAFWFDNDHDGSSVEEGDDGLVLGPSMLPPGNLPPGRFIDNVRSFLPPCPAGSLCGFWDTDVGGTMDGAGVYGVAGGKTYFELAHPLDSADNAHDFSLAPGDAVGFGFQLAIEGADGYVFTLPAGGDYPLVSSIVVAKPAPLLVQGAGIVLEHRLLGSFSVNLSYDGLTAKGAMAFTLPVTYQGGNAYLTASSTSPRFAYVDCRAGKPVSATFSGDGSFVLRSPRGAILLSGTGYIKATLGEGRTGTLSGYVAPTGPPFMSELQFPNTTFIGHLGITNAYCPT